MAQSDPATNENTPKKSTSYIKLVSFYNKHFPTDRRSFNVRVPIIGLIISVLSVYLISSIFFRYEYFINILFIAYLIIAASVGYELYWGLKIGDRKHYTPWILWKIFEIIFTISGIIYDICERGHYFNQDTEIKSVFVIFLLLFNIISLYFVLCKSLKYLNNSGVTNGIINGQIDGDEQYYENT